MDPPSRELVELLTDSGLATRRDLSRCTRYVRRFARDLPTFDSVWVDALVRIHALTPFQAQMVLAGDVESLRVGEWVLEERIQWTRQLEVFRARHGDSKQQATVSRFRAQPAMLRAAEERWRRLQARIDTVRLARSTAPQQLEPAETCWWVISPRVDGVSLENLIVRRGRIPVDVVAAIACQLSQELVTLHRGSVPHGDLRCANVFLSPQGRVQLLHHGVLESLEPGRPLVTQRPLECFDGMAPERSDGELDDAARCRTDVYALGCLMWQLLVGRAPFPMADPLLKQAAHRGRQVPAVRDWTPDVPDRVNDLIAQMTNKDAARRPTMMQVHEVLRPRYDGMAKRLANFVRGCESASARPLVAPGGQRLAALNPQSGSVGAFLAVTGGLLLLAAGLWLGPQWYGDGQPTPIAMQAAEDPARPNAAADRDRGMSAAEIDVASVTTNPLIDMPEPNAAGQLLLLPGRYRVRELSRGEKLLIIGPSEGTAEIVIHASPWRLQAPLLSLANVRLVDERSAPHRSSPLLEIAAQELAIDAVETQTPLDRNEPMSSATPQVATGTPHNLTGVPQISWSMYAPGDPNGGRLYVRGCSFMAGGDVLSVEGPLTAAAFENVLQTGRGSLLTLHEGVRAGVRAPLQFQHCTLRDTSAAVRWLLSAESLGGQLSIQGRASVLELAPGTALVEFTGGRLSPEWEQHLEVVAEGLILPADRSVVGYRYLESPTEFRTLPTRTMQIDGLLAGDVEFHGAGLSRREDSLLRSAAVPLLPADQQPGIGDIIQ
ncbi:MAG: protein kinase [Planctomycetaceae bacterium]|nr:protein kinase [Planctomycetaceae bacterium]